MRDRSSRRGAKLSLFLVAIILIFAFLRWFSPSDQDEIIQVLKDLSNSGSFEGEGHPFVQLEWASGIMKSCTEPCTVKLRLTDELREYRLSRKEGAQHLVAIRKHLSQVALAILSPKIELNAEGATVHAQARAMGRSPGREDYFLESHPVEIKLIQEDGEWLISSIENLDTIETGKGREKEREAQTIEAHEK